MLPCWECYTFSSSTSLKISLKWKFFVGEMESLQISFSDVGKYNYNKKSKRILKQVVGCLGSAAFHFPWAVKPWHCGTFFLNYLSWVAHASALSYLGDLGIMNNSFCHFSIYELLENPATHWDIFWEKEAVWYDQNEL